MQFRVSSFGFRVSGFELAAHSGGTSKSSAACRLVGGARRLGPSRWGCSRVGACEVTSAPASATAVPFGDQMMRGGCPPSSGNPTRRSGSKFRVSGFELAAHSGGTSKSPVACPLVGGARRLGPSRLGCSRVGACEGTSAPASATAVPFAATNLTDIASDLPACRRSLACRRCSRRFGLLGRATPLEYQTSGIGSLSLGYQQERLQAPPVDSGGRDVASGIDAGSRRYGPLRAGQVRLQKGRRAATGPKGPGSCEARTGERITDRDRQSTTGDGHSEGDRLVITGDRS